MPKKTGTVVMVRPLGPMSKLIPATAVSLENGVVALEREVMYDPDAPATHFVPADACFEYDAALLEAVNVSFQIAEDRISVAQQLMAVELKPQAFAVEGLPEPSKVLH